MVGVIDFLLPLGITFDYAQDGSDTCHCQWLANTGSAAAFSAMQYFAVPVSAQKLLRTSEPFRSLFS